MAVKYECPKCNRRFTEWGAEKFGFKCPSDEWCPADHPKDIDLVRVGAAETKSSKRPSLKRTPRRTSMPVPVPLDIEEEEEMMTESFEPSDDDAETEVMAGIPAEPVDAEPFGADAEVIEIEDPGEDAIDLDMPEDDIFGEAGAPPAGDIPADAEEPGEEWKD